MKIICLPITLLLCHMDERRGASEDKYKDMVRTVEWIQKKWTNRKTGREEP